MDGQNIEFKNSMKALVIMVLYGLDWSNHIHNVEKRKDIYFRTKIPKEISKWNSIPINSSKFILLHNFLCILSMVWLFQKCQLWTIQCSTDYSATAGRDYKNEISKAELIQTCKRATPNEWVKYLTASRVKIKQLDPQLTQTHQ